MSLLPESGKPIDLDRTKIKSAEDADIVLAWLDALIVDMQHQILQHLTNTNLDLEWLSKVRGALRATVRTRFLTAEMRKQFENPGALTREQAFIEAAEEYLDPGEVKNIWAEAERLLRGEALAA